MLVSSIIKITVVGQTAIRIVTTTSIILFLLTCKPVTVCIYIYIYIYIYNDVFVMMIFLVFCLMTLSVNIVELKAEFDCTSV
jgi:hypothetical protein